MPVHGVHIRVGQLPAGGAASCSLGDEAEAAGEQARLREGVHRPHAHHRLDQGQRLGLTTNSSI